MYFVMKEKFKTITVSIAISVITVGIYFASVFIIKTAASNYSPKDIQEDMRVGILTSNPQIDQTVTTTATFTAIPIGRHCAD